MHKYKCIHAYIHNFIRRVVGVTKMGNNVPRAGLELTSLALQASVLPLHHIDSLKSPLYPRLPGWVAPCFRGQCRLLHSSPWNYKSFNAYNCIQAMALQLHRVGSTNIQHVACTGSRSCQPVSWVGRKWEIMCLEQDSNPHLWHSGPVCYHCTM